VSTKSVYVIECEGGPLTGSKVKILKEGDYLTLCEVQVLGVEKKSNYVNVALEGKATQDTTGWSGVASRAIDGNTDSNYWGNSCSHNAATSGGWWQFTLDEPTNIQQVVIYNREDCCQSRIDKTKVYLDGELCGKVNYIAGQTVYKIGCGNTEASSNGSVVRIESNSGSYLTLCEVEVLSDPDFIGGDGLANLAKGKPTSQSSTGWGGVPSRAVDGKKSTQWSSGTCTHTAATTGNWWMVDLEDNFLVEKIKITNRGDCCRDRINGAKVYVGDELCGEIEYSGITNTYSMKCGMVGNFVRIVNDNSYLTLCEVQVMGNPTPVDTENEETVVDIGEKSCGGDDCMSTATCPAVTLPLDVSSPQEMLVPSRMVHTSMETIVTQ